MKLIIDAHSWIEYLEGSASGEKLNKLLNEENEIYVLPITISEVVSKVKRSGKDSQLAYDSIIKNARILEPTPKIAKEAGLLHAEIRKKNPSFGIVDAILLSAAKSINAKVVTGDNHFRQFDNVILI